MPTYRVNDDAVRQARKLIDDGKVDVDTQWSDAAPSADDGNAEIEEHGYQSYGAWHLAVDPDASDRPPAGSRRELASGGGQGVLSHGKQRAAQNDHDEIEKAFDDLLQRLDAERG